MVRDEETGVTNDIGWRVFEASYSRTAVYRQRDILSFCRELRILAVITIDILYKGLQ